MRKDDLSRVMMAISAIRRLATSTVNDLAGRRGKRLIQRN